MTDRQNPVVVTKKQEDDLTTYTFTGANSADRREAALLLAQDAEVYSIRVNQDKIEVMIMEGSYDH